MGKSQNQAQLPNSHINTAMIDDGLVWLAQIGFAGPWASCTLLPTNLNMASAATMFGLVSHLGPIHYGSQLTIDQRTQVVTMG